MAHIIQHIPSYCSGFEIKKVHFKSTKSLLKIDFVKQWTEDKKFYRFSVSQDAGHPPYLMVELDNGYTWYVVGLVYSFPSIKKLPKWTPKYTEEELEKERIEKEEALKRFKAQTKVKRKPIKLNLRKPTKGEKYYD